MDRPLVAEGGFNGGRYEAQCRGTSGPGRAEPAHTHCRAWAGDLSARAADARRTCRAPEGRDREVVADHQSGEHQGRVIERDRGSMNSVRRLPCWSWQPTSIDDGK